jgi:hypothetical protein
MADRHATTLGRTVLVALLALLPAAAIQAQGPPAVVEHYHLDALGSVRVVTNQAGPSSRATI